MVLILIFYHSGLLRVRAYRSETGAEPLAIIAGDIRDCHAVPVRVHDACLTSEALGSLKYLFYVTQYTGDIAY